MTYHDSNYATKCIDSDNNSVRFLPKTEIKKKMVNTNNKTMNESKQNKLFFSRGLKYD